MMNDFYQRLAGLSPAKRALLASKLTPASFSQQRLWLLHETEMRGSGYNLPAAISFKGELKIGVLQDCLTEIVRRHQALRTTFAMVEGDLAQIVVQLRPVAASLVDLSELPDASRRLQVKRLIQIEAEQPFDLANGPLWRAGLVRLSEREHIVMITLHHIVCDAWSIGILVQEFGALYRAFSKGLASPLQELPIQYTDFAVWQKEWLQGEVLDKQVDYWKRQLGDDTEILELPADHPRPPLPSFRGGRCPVRLSKDLLDSLRALNNQSRTTLFMTLLAAFQTLLYRYTGRESISVGAPVAGRNRKETEGLIGLFLNTLVIRTRLKGDQTFLNLLERVKDVTLEAFANQDAPFERLVEEISPYRAPNVTPLTQVLFVLQNTPSKKLELPDLCIEPLGVEKRSTRFDLSLDLIEAEGGIQGVFIYNQDLYDAPRIDRMAGHFNALLQSIGADPGQRLCELALLTTAEHRQLTLDWNRIEPRHEEVRTIQAVIERHARDFRNALAVIFRDEQLTYGELNSRANKIAHYLKRVGVGPETRVGVCLNRCVDMIIGVLGVLKTGAAYVPLDPEYPEERIAFMMKDASVSVLLTQSHLSNLFSDHSTRTFIVSLDSDWRAISYESDEDPMIDPEPESIAYVIYTSGSTGAPKGVCVSHRAAFRHFRAIQQEFNLTHESRVLQFASPSFDVSLEQVLPTLMSGAAVFLRDTDLWSPSDLMAKIGELGLTVVNLPTPYWHQLVQVLPTDGESAAARLGLMIAGGDQMLPEPAWMWRQSALREVRLLNAYGPTETTITATVCEIASEFDRETPPRTVPIGRRVGDRALYVLDNLGELLPIGVTGELYIGGPLVARGYLDRPDLTADRFVPDKFCSMEGQRLYKTGDLARYRADGNVEFIGRIDCQVKIRGFRIELGEVESVICGHPAVKEVAVVAHQEDSGEKRLIAYLVSSGHSGISGEELREFLTEKLPSYMIPAAFILLDSLPLTPNGKLDRRSLPYYHPSRLELTQSYLAPRNPTEEKLAKIWREVLRLERVGVNDNYFELGGDSITAIQIIARCNRVGLWLTPKHVFEHPTIAGLASAISDDVRVDVEQSIVAGPVPLTPIQNWFFEQQAHDPHHWNQALMLEVHQPVAPHVWVRLIERLISHHDALRLRFTLEGATWKQFNDPPSCRTPFAQIDVASVSPEKQKTVIEAAAAQLQVSLDLSRSPLLQAVIFKTGNGLPDRLLLLIHHLVVDGVSWRILLEDLASMLSDRDGGSELPLKSSSFKQWAESLVQFAQTEELKLELEFWLGQASMQSIHLPRDYDNAENTVASARSVRRSLNADETRVLLQGSHGRYRAQIEDILLMALACSFSRWLGPGLLPVDLEGHGREQAISGVDVTRTVGWFTTIFPVLLDLNEQSSTDQALQSIKERMGRIPNRGIGYGALRYLNGSPDVREKMRRMASAEVCFNYMGQLDQALAKSSIFSLARESCGPRRSPAGRRPYLIEVDARIVGGCLNVSFTYSEKVHQRSVIERLADIFLKKLQTAAIDCGIQATRSLLASNFPLAKINQQQLDKVLSEINKNQA